MITYVQGSIFQSPAQVLVNSVNTVGVMGKGIALEFKRLYPEMFNKYQSLCEAGELEIGTLFLYKSQNKWILNFPTKIHWKHPSKVFYIEQGLEAFVRSYTKLNIHSVAFPALGCGNGELDFESVVQPVMEKYLKNLLIDIFIYPDKHEINLPEHKQQDAFRKWLRSKPQSLAFTEVWDDLCKIIRVENSFKTLFNKTEFSIKLLEGEKNLLITSSKKMIVTYEELLGLWQQLRNYGFISRKFISGLNQEIYYLFPLFEKLPYIQIVKISETFESFNQPAYAMQLNPLGFTNQIQSIQLSLFDEVIAAN